MTDSKDSKKAKGGSARAAALTPERRSEIARKAASSRWDADLPIATHEGEFKLGDSVVLCAVLPNGLRVITQATFLRSLGRSRSPKAGTGVLSTVDDLPFFLQAEVLKPFISEELAMSTTPIFYRSATGSKGVGYDARLLPQVAEVYLKYRDSVLASSGKIPAKYAHIIQASDILMRGLATVGIISLVDEATGYQEVRDRLALQKILDKFLTAERAKWAKTFPDDFYRKMFKLKKWDFNPSSVRRPGVIGHYTNDIVYNRLAPGILDKLKELNPKTDNGSRKGKHFQHLTNDYGLPELKDHLTKVMFLMDAAGNDWKLFMTLLNRAAPKYGSTLEIPFDE